MARSAQVISPGAEEGKLPGHFSERGRKAHSLCPPQGRAWRPVGGDGLSESRASSCPLPSSGGGRPEARGRCGKGAVQFHFLHALFTQVHTLPLGWGTFGVALGYLLLRMHEGSPCQGGEGDRVLPARSHIGGGGMWRQILWPLPTQSCVLSMYGGSR